MKTKTCVVSKKEKNENFVNFISFLCGIQLPCDLGSWFIQHKCTGQYNLAKWQWRVATDSIAITNPFLLRKSWFDLCKSKEKWRRNHPCRFNEVLPSVLKYIYLDKTMMMLIILQKKNLYFVAGLRKEDIKVEMLKIESFNWKKLYIKRRAGWFVYICKDQWHLRLGCVCEWCNIFNFLFKFFN